MKHPFVLSLVVLLLSCELDLASGNELESAELSRVRERWDRCCRSSESRCVEDTCYTMEWRVSTWSSVRNRCRSRFPDWYESADLADIPTKEHVMALVSLLKELRYNRRTRAGTALWTSGSRCRTVDSGGKMSLKYVWANDETEFDEWLIREINASNIPSKEKSNCDFLTITSGSDYTKLNFDFQEEEREYSGVCQFIKPNGNKKTTPTTTIHSTSSSTPSSTPSTFSSPTSSSRTTTRPSSTTPKSETQTSTTATDTTPTRKTTRTASPTTKSTSTSKSVKIRTLETTGTPSSDTTRKSETEPTSTTEFTGCRGSVTDGIVWPNTLPGKTVRRKCPEGMKGTAEWTCDASTLMFRPPRPRIRECRHEWFDNLQKEIESSKDAVELSKRIANKTTHTRLSHGDLFALVNLTEKLLVLYESQKKRPQILHQTEKPRSYHFAKAVATSYSHVLRSDVLTAWTDLEARDQLEQASRILQQMSTTGHHLGCSVNSERILQHTLSEENINLQTFLLDTSGRKKQAYVFPQGIPGEVNNTLILSGQMNLDSWQESKCQHQRKTGVGILYKHLEQFLQKEDALGKSPVVVSSIISFSINNWEKSARLPPGLTVDIELERNTLPENIHLYKAPKCVFWNFSLGEFGDWDSSGCKTLHSNSSHTTCSCDHLTNFAIIMDVNNNISVDDKILEYMTIVCCAVSTIALLATCTALLGIRALRCRRSTITCNLSFCLLFVNLIILFGFDQTRYALLCALIAGFLQFFILSAFCWMLLEGFHLYQMVVLVFSQSSHLAIGYFYSVGYGIPAIIVAVSAAIEYEGYGRKDVCWLSNEQGLMWSLVGPVAVITIINLVIFVWTMKSASSARIKKEQTAAENAKAWIKGSLSILCLLGLTWSVGFLYMINRFYYSSYVFTVLNGLQGVFIFVFHVLLNEKTTNAFLKTFGKNFKRKGFQRRRPDTASSIEQLRSKRSTSSGLTVSTRTDSGHRGSSPNVIYNPQLQNRLLDGCSERTKVHTPSAPPYPSINSGDIACNGRYQQPYPHQNGESTNSR